MKIRLFILIVAQFLCSELTLLTAQTDTLEIPVDDQIENIIESTVEDVEETDLNETIEDLILSPIELNSASIDDLNRIPYLNLQLATDIVKHREKFGFFYSISELNSVPSITEEMFQKIKPFLYIDRAKFTNLQQYEPATQKMNQIDLQLRQRYYQSFPNRKGYETEKYFNSPYKFYNRFLFNYSKNYSLSILTEKDPGEKKLTDFVSASFMAHDFLIFNKIILGDYALEFGQGLAIWRQIGFSKGPDAIYPIKRKGRGIVQYKSTDENQFFRGFAFSSSYRSFEFIFYFSNKSFDARIDPIEGVILSTPIDGYHRNESEINKRNASSEQMIGSRLNFNHSLLQMGLNFYKSHFRNPYSPNSYFKKYEKEFHYLSSDFNFFLSSINIFGEFVKDKENNIASLVGLQAAPTGKTSFILLLRNYPAEYINIHGYAFGERNGSTNNEKGIYLGIKHSDKFGTVNLYFDQFKFLYPLTYDKTLTGGQEILLAYESPIISKTKYIARYKKEIKEKNSYSYDYSGRTKKTTDVKQQQNIRFEIQKFFGRNNRTTFRIEYINVFNQFNSKSENGLLSFGDLSLQLSNNITMKTRFTYFQTDSYDSRIYQLEGDVPGAFYSIALYGRGIRWYLVLNAKLFKLLNLSLKYSELYRDDLKKIGSGYDEIPTNLTNTLTLQLEIKF